MTPERVQRRRTKGWRMPPDTVYVGRPSRWGNLWRVGECGACAFNPDHDGPHDPLTQDEAVAFARAYLQSQPARDFRTLRGKNLACWCPLDQPCHADVLLELANA